MRQENYFQDSLCFKSKQVVKTFILIYFCCSRLKLAMKTNYLKPQTVDLEMLYFDFLKRVWD